MSEQNGSLAHVLWRGLIWRCRRTRMFALVRSRTKHSQWPTVSLRMARRMVVWDRVVHAKQQHLSSKVCLGWYFPSLGE